MWCSVGYSHKPTISHNRKEQEVQFTSPLRGTMLYSLVRFATCGTVASTFTCSGILRIVLRFQLPVVSLWMNIFQTVNYCHYLSRPVIFRDNLNVWSWCVDSFVKLLSTSLGPGFRDRNLPLHCVRAGILILAGFLTYSWNFYASCERPRLSPDGAA